MFYVGDLSVQDVNLLCTLSRSANSILEFGVGASTQILAQAAPTFANITSVETDPEWISRTKAILDLIKSSHRIEFKTYDEWREGIDNKIPAQYDLIFNDGVDNLRADFAERSWPLLSIGGYLVFHDTRRSHDFSNVLNFCQQHYLEINDVKINANSSNLTLMTKKLPEPYVNWNAVENRSVTMAGYSSLEETLAYVRDNVGRY
jgi:tRNA A58 N-methylase Trm61